jgi:hypothetical protein
MASVPDELLIETVATRAAHKSLLAAAKAAGVPENTFRNRLLRAAARGLDGNVAGTTPLGQVVKGTTTLYDSEGGQVLQWVKRDSEPTLADVAGAMSTAFDGVKPLAKPAKAPQAARGDLLTLSPIGDLHLGMYAWGKESGDNWDLKIAEDIIGRAVDEVVMASPQSGTGIVLFGGDYFHADNKNNQTSRSHNVLDVDGRYDKVIHAGTRLAARIVDRHLLQHERVIVRVLKGNHDEHSSVALAYYLLGHYRNEPRVFIDVDPSLFFYHRFGDVLIGATHGHETKIEKLPQVMSVRRARIGARPNFVSVMASIFTTPRSSPTKTAAASAKCIKRSFRKTAGTSARDSCPAVRCKRLPIMRTLASTAAHVAP